MAVEHLKKVTLGYYPTPLEEMKNLEASLNKGKLYIKRDDLTGPAMGGNKTRKLEYLLQEAIDTGCTAVLTFGGPQTNHGRTTVGAAVKLGLKPILMLDGEDTGYLSGNLTLDSLMGADIYFVKDEASMDEKVAEVLAKYEANGDKVYQIPVGGSNVLGAVGYVMAIKEIMEQIKEQGITIDHLVCASGSRGTYAGLLVGMKYFNAPFDIIGIPISPRAEGVAEEALLAYTKEISERFEMGIEVTSDDIKIMYGPEEALYSGVKYNEPDAITREAIITLAKTEAIFLDPTYTGKVFRGFLDFVKEGESTLLLHSGGTVALWTKEHLDDMQEQLRGNCTITQL